VLTYRVRAPRAVPPTVFVLLSAFSRAPGAEATNAVPAAETVMPAIVVTATREARPARETPCAMSVLSAGVLREDKAARTVPDALRAEPGIMAQKTAHAQGSPYIRGFTGYRNLFLIDGVRLNNSVFRDGPNQYWSTVDPLGLSRLEVVRGPFSVLYGSDAIGGTVNAVTRGAQDLRPGSGWDRSLYYRYADAENAHVARLETIGRATANLVLTAGYSYKDFGDVRGGKSVGVQPRTGYGERDWDAKAEYFVGDNAWLVLAHQSVDIDDAWRTHKTVHGIDWAGLTVGEELRRALDQNRDLTYLQYHHLDLHGPVEEIHAGVSRHLQSETQDRLRTGDRHDVQGFDVETAGAFFTLKSPSPAGRLIYGAEFYRDDVASYLRTLNSDGTVRATAIQGPVGDNAAYDLLGTYLQDEIPLASRLVMILGARYELARAAAGAVQDPATGERIAVAGAWDDLAGSARMLCHLNEQRTWSAFAGVSQGFRAPNLSDLTRFDTARTDEIETPSPDLDPEHYVSCEAGLKAATPELSAQLACFHTDVAGMIARTPTGRVIDGNHEVTKRNSGDGYVQGVEIDARYRVRRGLSAFGAFTYMDGRVEAYPTSGVEPVTEYIDRLMPPTGRVGLRWDGDGRYWIEGACTAASRADRLSTQDRSDSSRIPPGGTPAYTVYDLRGGWNLKEGLSLSLAVENLTDEDYRIHGSGVNEPGRNFVAAMQSTF